MTQEPYPYDFLLTYQRKALAGEQLDPAFVARLITHLIEARHHYSGSRRVLDRWQQVDELLEFLKIWFRQNGKNEFADHIDHVIMGIGGQP